MAERQENKKGKTKLTKTSSLIHIIKESEETCTQQQQPKSNKQQQAKQMIFAQSCDSSELN